MNPSSESSAVEEAITDQDKKEEKTKEALETMMELQQLRFMLYSYCSEEKQQQQQKQHWW